MGFDIPTVLTVITVIAGIIALFDCLILARLSSSTKLRAIGEYARSIFPILFVVLLVRCFVFESFRIPSASMMPGLVDGDFILVDKYSYGLKLPAIGTKIVSIGEPRRGDVVVFHSPADHSIYLIKRCIGLPGDHIVVQDNRLFVNGQEMRATPDGMYEGGYGYDGSNLEVEQFGGSSHKILLAKDRWVTDFDGTVPPKHYFFMGDNRNDSEDSRFPDVGYVPERNLVGHARLIYMHWRIPGWPDLHRVDVRIR